MSLESAIMKEPKYPGATIRTCNLVWGSTGELGEVRIMDYGSGSKQRFRVAAFCPGRCVELPGDTPKMEPEVDKWCATWDEANEWFGLYVDREIRDGWSKPMPKFELQGLVERIPGSHGESSSALAKGGVVKSSQDAASLKAAWIRDMKTVFGDIGPDYNIEFHCTVTQVPDSTPEGPVPPTMKLISEREDIPPAVVPSSLDEPTPQRAWPVRVIARLFGLHA